MTTMLFQRDPVTNQIQMLYLPFRRDRLSLAEVLLVGVMLVVFGGACALLGAVWMLENAQWGGAP